MIRPSLGIALLAVVTAAGRPAAAEESAVDRLEVEWPSAKDDVRTKLIEGVVAKPSPVAFAALRDTAAVAAGMATEAERMRRTLRRDDDGATIGKAPPTRRAGGDAGLDDVESRERRGLDVLAVGASKVLSTLSDADLEAALRDALAAAGRTGASPLLADWAAQAFGATAQARVVPLALAISADRLKAHRKTLEARAVPAKKLDEVNAKMADLSDRYLKNQQKRGDFSGKVPSSLYGTLPDQKSKLEREILGHQEAIDAADVERSLLRRALARVLAAMPDVDVERSLGLVERACLADPDLDVRTFGLAALALAPGERALGHLRTAASDADPRVAMAALEALGERGGPEAVALLETALADLRWRVRAAAALGLARTGRAIAVPGLIAALETAEGRTLDDLRDALRGLTGLALPAAADPWKAWWEREGATFRGPKDPPAAAAGGVARGPDAPRPDDPPAAGGGVSFYGIETHSKRVLFVVDFSGSMNFPGSEHDRERKKIDVLRDELRKTVGALPDGAVFNLVRFASDVHVWREAPVVRGAKTAAAALEWVGKTEAVGATNIYDALETAFRLMGVGAAKDRSSEPAYDTVFFMTDGKPTAGKVVEPARILSEVRRWNASRRVRIHVVGMGGHGKSDADTKDDVDPQFLRALAQENGGDCLIR